jgi:hypothetical protein
MKTTYYFEFNTPSELSHTNPMQKVSKLIELMHKKIGYEQLNMRLFPILTEWGLRWMVSQNLLTRFP